MLTSICQHRNKNTHHLHVKLKTIALLINVIKTFLIMYNMSRIFL
jgi:hypothetical protein